MATTLTKTAEVVLGELQSFEQRSLAVYLSRDDDELFYPVRSVKAEPGKCLLCGALPIGPDYIAASVTSGVLNVEEVTALVAACAPGTQVRLSFNVPDETLEVGLVSKSFVDERPFVRIYTKSSGDCVGSAT